MAFVKATSTKALNSIGGQAILVCFGPKEGKRKNVKCAAGKAEGKKRGPFKTSTQPSTIQSREGTKGNRRGGRAIEGVQEQKGSQRSLDLTQPALGEEKKSQEKTGVDNEEDPTGGLQDVRTWRLPKSE